MTTIPEGVSLSDLPSYGGLYFMCTCGACPEQYDVFDADGNEVGYVRLRHGALTAEYTGEGANEEQYILGELVYENDEDVGDGCFDTDPMRDKHLAAIGVALQERMSR